MKTVTSQKRSLETRSKILNAAKLSFAQHGFDATSFRNIAIEAEVNHAVISYHFGSKEELWTAVIKELHKALANVSPFQVKEAIDYRIQFKAQIKAMVSYFAKEPYLIRIVYQESLSNNSRLLKLFPLLQAYRDGSHEYLKKLKEVKLLKDIPIEDMTSLFACIITSRFVHDNLFEKLAGTNPPLDELIERHAEGIAQLFCKDKYFMN
jgi:AcrR family transcriptional regulator